MRSLPLSTIYIFPEASRAIPRGKDNLLAEEPLPFPPATVVPSVEGPFATVGQLSTSSVTPSPSVSFCESEHPLASTASPLGVSEQVSTSSFTPSPSVSVAVSHASPIPSPSVSS